MQGKLFYVPVDASGGHASEIIVGNRQIIKNQLIDALERFQPKGIIVDLSRITYIDASGLGMLVTVRKRLLEYLSVGETNRDRMTLLKPTKDVMTLLEITKFDTLFEVSDVDPDASEIGFVYAPEVPVNI